MALQLNITANIFSRSIADSKINLQRVAAISALLSVMLAGCGGGGGSGQPIAQPPPPPPPITFQLIFPGETSLTDSDQISVVGSADANRLMSVAIKNGSDETPASLDSAGRWRASNVPLQPGSNQFVVKLTDNNGAVTELPISTVQSAPILSNPIAALFDALNDRVLILDPKQLLSFDLLNKELEVLSAPGIGLGPNFGFARHFTLDSDGAILVATLDGIQRVDPITGDRSEHVVLPSRSGPISAIALDKQLGRLFAVGFFGDLYAADLSLAPPILASTIKPLPTFGVFGPGPTDGIFVSSTDAIYTVSVSAPNITEIDASTGDTIPIFLDFGSVITPITGVEFDEVASRVLILGISGAVFSLDPTTLISSLILSPPPPLNLPAPLRGLSIGGDKLWTVAPVPGELLSIDMTTGSQTIETTARVGEGVPPGPMLAGRYDAAADRFVAIADLRVIAIDPKTGSRELLADLFDPSQPSTPPSFILASGIALSQDGTRAWVPDLLNQMMTEVDLVSGEVRIVSGPNVGAGPLPDLASGIAVDSENSAAYVGDRFTQRVIQIDLVNGQRVELASLPAALAESEIRSLVLDSVANRLLLNIAPLRPTSSVEPSIYSLDLVSLEFSQLANLSSVELPFGESTSPGISTMQMSLSADGESLYTPVSGNADLPYVRVDLALGALEPLGSANTGVPFLAPNAIEVTPDDRIFALDGTGALLVVDSQTGERSIISK